MKQFKNTGFFVNVYMTVFVFGLLSLFFIEKGNAVIVLNSIHTSTTDVLFKYVTHIGDGLLFIPLIIILLFICWGFLLVSTIGRWVGPVGSGFASCGLGGARGRADPDPDQIVGWNAHRGQNFGLYIQRILFIPKPYPFDFLLVFSYQNPTCLYSNPTRLYAYPSNRVQP